MQLAPWRAATAVASSRPDDRPFKWRGLRCAPLPLHLPRRSVSTEELVAICTTGDGGLEAFQKL
jgi:hypothetical protein